MIKNYTLSAVFVLLGLLSTYAQDKSSFNTYWDNGLKIESSDKAFKIKMGGRLQYDVMFIDQSDSLNSYFPNTYNGAEFRRARYFMSGKIYDNISYKVQIDFAGSKLVVKDAWLNFGKLPLVGNLKVGKFKVPIGLNTLTSSKYITMMERPITSNYDSDRHLGFMLHRNHFDKRFSWQAGFFYPEKGTNKYLGNGYSSALRLVGLPIYNVNNTYKVLHIAVAASSTFHNNEEYSVSMRPDAHLGPKYSKLKFNGLKHENSLNLEFSFIINSLSFQGEYHTIKYTPTGDLPMTNLTTYYATVSYFITGEHRNYSKSKTAFDKIKPKKNFGKDGWGAFELAARYSHIDDNDYYVSGGEMNNVTLGVNWYLNPATKVVFNYVYSQNPAYDGWANIYQMRFQVAF